MHICLICTEKLPVPAVKGGAIQQYIDGVLPYLRQHHAVTVVCRRDLALPEHEWVAGVRYVRVDPGRSPQEYCENAARFIAGQQVDLVDIFNRPAFVPTIAAAAGQAKLVLSMHNDMFGHSRLPVQTAREVLERVNAVVTISDYVARTIDQLHPGFSDRLQTIRSGVDPDRYRPIWAARARRQRIRRRLGLLGRPVVLHVSRHSPKKGNHLVIQAMRGVLARHPHACLLMVGSRWYGVNDTDDYTLALRLLAMELGGAVKFMGFVPPADMAELYLAGDLFVNASQWAEPLARVHYEAMAAGLPIITTDRGGNAEVIEPGRNGLIVDPYDDPGAYSEQICTLLADPILRGRMGRHGRSLVEERYTFARVAQELLEVFARCASS